MRSLLLLFISIVYIEHASTHILRSVGHVPDTKSHVSEARSHVTAPCWQPEQLHLSLTGRDNQMVAVWSTRNKTASFCEFGAGELSTRVQGREAVFVDGGVLRKSQWIHIVIMSSLKPGRRYIYHCGSQHGWSALYYFKQPRLSDTKSSVKLAVYGDMGVQNAVSLAELQSKAQKQEFDGVLHIGDFAYDMYEDNGSQGDSYMNMIEPIAAYVPYMTCQGNHEEMYNFSHYKNRFSMPTPNGKNTTGFYTFNWGPATFIAINTEAYFFYDVMEQIHTQINWLKEALKEANSVENRRQRPWLIVYGHRPLYCTNNDQWCEHGNSEATEMMRKSYEQLLVEAKVDLALWGHEHSYERLWPLNNFTYYDNKTSAAPYHNAKSVVHVITGSAGCREDHSAFDAVHPPWSAFRVEDYGYTELEIKTDYLGIKQYSIAPQGTVDHPTEISEIGWREGKVVDEIKITKSPPANSAFEN